MVELFDRWVHTLGALGYPALALAALLEYLVPPLPGDTVTLLGGAWAARGERSFPLVLLSVTLGSMVGICVNYAVGRALGARVDRLPEGRLLFGITHASIRRVQDLMKDRGEWLLVANRFLPSFRAVLFVAAGASHMAFPRVLGLGTVSALAWNTMLLSVGLAVGDNADRIEAFLSTYRTAALAVVGVALAGVLVRWLWRRGRAQSGPE